MTERKSNTPVLDQVLGGTVEQANVARAASEAAALAEQEASLARALEEMQRARDFLGDPGSILGNDRTKHGEIAEVFDVRVHNARNLVQGQDATATLDVPGGRIGVADYRIGEVDVQSKFNNGLRNSLDAIRGHSTDYPEFLPGGGTYAIPKDQYDQLVAISRGEAVDLGAQKTENIRAWLQRYEEETGRPFTETVKPSVSTYRDVQQGVANETLDKHEADVKQKSDEREGDIRSAHEPSLAEGLKVSAQAAAIAGGVSLVTNVWRLHKEGRNIFKGELTVEDWKDIGIDVAVSSGVAAVTAGAIYAATNLAGMSAPVASALATAIKGVGSLAIDYQAGRISLDVFVEQGLYVCSETAVLALASAAGQALIPVPVLGALIGSLAGKFLLGAAGKFVQELKPKVAQFEAELQAVIAQYEVARRLVHERFDRFDLLISSVFVPPAGVSRIEASATLARDAEVSDALVVRGLNDFEDFLAGRHRLNELTAMPTA